MAPFKRRLSDRPIAAGFDDCFHDSVLGFFDDADDVEGGDEGRIFGEDEAGGCAVDAELEGGWREGEGGCAKGVVLGR